MMERVYELDDAEILKLYDHDERYAATALGLRREVSGSIVRHVDLHGRWGVVIHSRLSADTADAQIDSQIAYFRALGQSFEWKAFAYDEPSDLVQRLEAHGFAVEEPEAVMVLDLQSYTPVETLPVRRVTTRAELRDVESVRTRVYGDEGADNLDQLAFELEDYPDRISVYVVSLDGAPAAAGWIRFPPGRAFASLWGGATVPELRNKGLYIALLHARVSEARQRDYRYVTIDAGAMSRPIVAKRGFRVLTYATECNWHA
jgi:GNAT superfamily N-acetyltransferase